MDTTMLQKQYLIRSYYLDTKTQIIPNINNGQSV